MRPVRCRHRQDRAHLHGARRRWRTRTGNGATSRTRTACSSAPPRDRMELAAERARRGQTAADSTDHIFAYDVKTGELRVDLPGQAHLACLHRHRRRTRVLHRRLAHAGAARGHAAAGQDGTRQAHRRSAADRRGPRQEGRPAARGGARCRDRQKGLGQAGGRDRLQRDRHRRRQPHVDVSERPHRARRRERQRPLLAAVPRGRILAAPPRGARRQQRRKALGEGCELPPPARRHRQRDRRRAVGLRSLHRRAEDAHASAHRRADAVDVRAARAITAARSPPRRT